MQITKRAEFMHFFFFCFEIKLLEIIAIVLMGYDDNKVESCCAFQLVPEYNWLVLECLGT